MKKATFFLICCAVTVGVVFAAIDSQAKVIKLGHIRDIEHPTHKGALAFAKLVDERTQGRIKINVFPNSQLGGIQEMFTQLQTGDLAMVYIHPKFWNSLSKEDQKILMTASEEAGALVTDLTRQQLKEAYDILATKMTLIKPPELDLTAIRKQLEGVFDDWEGKKWPAGLLKKIGSM